MTALLKPPANVSKLGDRKIYTVSEINREVRSILESRFARVWIEGEISNFKHHSSGHMYLSLKDETSQISAAFFSRYNQSLKFDLKDGLKVLVQGRLSLYEARGQYQLYIERVEPKGLGALQLAFLQLKEKLQKEGLFAAEKKQALPRFPRVVGLVTSPTGAAIRDMLQVMNRRFKGTQVLLYPVKVQGDGAAEEIAEAVSEMNRLNEVDVLIVGRGGGSLEDLWAFNEEVVARAVSKSKIPIISAVGHEIDWTICDMVADMRAPTPSAAAELVVQNREEIVHRLNDMQSRMRLGMSRYIEARRQMLDGLQSSYAFSQPRILLEQFSQRVDELSRQTQNYLKALVQSKKQDFQVSVGRLKALSPLAILERGYSITFDRKGKLLKDFGQVKVGDQLTTRVKTAQVISEVKKVESVKKK